MFVNIISTFVIKTRDEPGEYQKTKEVLAAIGVNDFDLSEALKLREICRAVLKRSASLQATGTI